MYSSRMRTVRYSGRLGGGVCLGDVCLGGISAGGCLPGVVAQGGCTPPPVDRILDTRL